MKAAPPRFRRASPKNPAFLKRADHARLWRIVEGAVADAFNCHPEYLSDAGRQAAVVSIVKRVVGELVGHAKGALRGGRFGASRAAGGNFPAEAVASGRGNPVLESPGAGGEACASPPAHPPDPIRSGLFACGWPIRSAAAPDRGLR